jgi:hypothetical protein
MATHDFYLEKDVKCGMVLGVEERGNETLIRYVPSERRCCEISKNRWAIHLEALKTAKAKKPTTERLSVQNPSTSQIYNCYGKRKYHCHGWWKIMHTNPKLNKKLSQIAMINWAIFCVTWITLFLEDSSTCCHLHLSVSYRKITRFRQLLMWSKGATQHHHLHWDITIGQQYVLMKTSIIHLSCISEDEDDKSLLHYFCFPTHGVAFPMYSGSVMCFNPLIPYVTCDATTKCIRIFSDYVY